MHVFVDRQQEMETLQSEYERNGSALVVLYGRRRVGKTTLISEFIRDKNALFFLASEESEAQNRAAFKEKAAEFIDSDLLRNADVKSWDVIFKAIVDAKYDSKPVIVLDEFQYLGKAEPAFPSIFQRIWEEILKKQSVMDVRPLVPKGSLKFLTAYYHLPFFSLPPIRIPAKRMTAVNAEIQIGESTHIQCHLITPDSFRTMNTIVRMDTMPSPPCFVFVFITVPLRMKFDVL